ncbi:TPA: NAD-dependent epimerase/dehydratase family protein [Candidatus Gracilibacteria bacterium]|nr:NAD-dependent epimerase/dehydratase family protein [Candidatus Gracilibacteria bacterium]HIQ57122.1 NAD-dependent epimerase/dehydratase family protein [Candidatus Gracilibacteria bacterium]
MNNKKKILITGGAGFIGSNFANIHNAEYEIVVLDNLFLGDKNNLNPDVQFVEGDACKQEDLDRAGDLIGGVVDYVIHFAGTSSQPMFNGDGFVWGYTNAISSFVNTLEWARKHGATKFLYASTSSLYANNPLPLVENQKVVPPNHYAVTKHLYEECSACYNVVYPEMDIIGFRFMSVYGPNEEAKGVYANLISQFAWDIGRDLAPVIYGDGTQTRDFTNIKDVVHGITLAMTSKEKLGADVFNIGLGKSTSLNDIVDALNKAFGKNIKPEYVDNPIKESYIQDQYADISKIQKKLGFRPTVTLVEGIKNQVENLRLEKVQKTSSDDFR